MCFEFKKEILLCTIVLVFFFRSTVLFLLSIKSLVFHHWILVWLLIWSNLVSFTYSASPEHSFPNIPFAAFSDTIQSIFGPNISLATVLTILFTLIENPDLLNLHLHQQQCKYNIENKVQISGWIIALVNALTNQLGSKRTEMKMNLPDVEEIDGPLVDSLKLALMDVD